MERVNFIQYKGKRILYIDFSNCDIGEDLKVIEKAKKIIRSQPEKSIFTLTNFTDTRFNDETTVALKEYVAGNKPYVIAAAVVGVTGIKQILYNSIMRLTGRKLTLFDTMDQAKEWLAEQ